ncbi:hypothetical protein A6F68_01587 [Tsuneonella dongtanensis]|uniref:DUF4349 domain-containing protein n=1 Tax=Tsuneonella dongtanensis TaxID=692370 RepID=A0A1B2AD53_9SPHN|nr:DUF4349 domain-containing protein [Tsuneonella dongtanensis]ANY20100.1 hypothetical protein A6F68_01587 [Tsuneonella dongtanensis]
MKKVLFGSCALALVLAGCSENAERQDGVGAAMEAAADSAVAEEMAQPAAAADDQIAGRAELPANMPKLAYAYGLSYRLPSDQIGKLMRSHANLCEQQGPSSCRIVGMDLSGDVEEDTVRGTLQLAVAASHARAVSALIEDEAEGAGAEQAKATIGSEEVSKQIVDTEARIRAREELRDRLLEVLRTRKGSVNDLVAAERSVAEVNEEIDQTRSWLAETKGRVAFSRMDIDYAPATAVAGDFTAPIEGALGSLGSILGNIVAVLIVLLAIALPTGGLVAGAIWLRRRLAAVPS